MTRVVSAGPDIAGGAAWASLSACVIAVFMQMLDTTIVNTALPDIAADLHASGSAQVLVVAAYSLTFACALLAAARLGAVRGRRPVFLFATAGFVAASLWCGLARHPVELIFARGAQGVLGAAMSAQTIAIVTACFPPARRTLAFALHGAAAGLAAMAGPLLGGALVAADIGGLGWRTIFLVNVPLGALGFALAHRYLSADPPTARTGLDPAGTLLATSGLFLLLYPLATGSEKHWPPALLALIVLAATVLAVFVAHQWRVRRADGNPLLDLGLFADPGFSAGVTATLVFFGAFAAFLFTVSVTAQTGLRFSALRTGLLMLPFAVGGALGAILSPALVTRWRAAAPTAGLALFALAIGTVATLVHPASATVAPLPLATPILLAGLGMGLFAAPLPALTIAGLGDRAASTASGLVPTAQQLGTAVGVAAGGTLFFSRLHRAVPSAVHHAAAQLDETLLTTGIPADRRTHVVAAFTDCATATLTAPTPHLDASTCAVTDHAVSGAVDAAGQLAAGETFLSACVVLLWSVAVCALALTVLTPALRTPVRSGL